MNTQSANISESHSRGCRSSKTTRIMHYQIFKSISLASLTSQASTRLELFQKDLSFVKSLVVLGIGAHAGKGSLAAVDAAAISAQPTNLSGTSTSHSSHHHNDRNLCGHAEVSTFSKLNKSHSCDAVFALETTLWLVYQNTPLYRIADKPDTLAKTYIYIEKPIDSTYPSIATSTKDQVPSRYMLNVILDKHLDRVWKYSIQTCASERSEINPDYLRACKR